MLHPQSRLLVNDHKSPEYPNCWSWMIEWVDFISHFLWPGIFERLKMASQSRHPSASGLRVTRRGNSTTKKMLAFRAFSALRCSFPGEEKTMETPSHTNILRYLNHLTLRPFGLVRQAVFWSEAVELSTCMRSWTSFSMRLGVIGENGAKAWNVNELQSIYSFTNKPSFWPVFLQDSCAFNIVDSQLTMFILFQH